MKIDITREQAEAIARAIDGIYVPDELYCLLDQIMESPVGTDWYVNPDLPWDDVDPALIEAARETVEKFHENRINLAEEKP